MKEHQFFNAANIHRKALVNRAMDAFLPDTEETDRERLLEDTIMHITHYMSADTLATAVEELEASLGDSTMSDDSLAEVEVALAFLQTLQKIRGV